MDEGVYDGYQAATSALPFGAATVAPGGSAVAWRPLVASAAIALVVVALHPLWRIGHGAPFAVLTVIGGLYAVAQQYRLAAARR